MKPIKIMSRIATIRNRVPQTVFDDHFRLWRSAR